MIIDNKNLSQNLYCVNRFERKFKMFKLYCLEPSEARCPRCWKLRSKCNCGVGEY